MWRRRWRRPPGVGGCTRWGASCSFLPRSLGERVELPQVQFTAALGHVESSWPAFSGQSSTAFGGADHRGFPPMQGSSVCGAELRGGLPGFSLDRVHQRFGAQSLFKLCHCDVLRGVPLLLGFSKVFQTNDEWGDYTVTLMPLLLIELILAFALPVVQMKRLSWSWSVASWCWHCDVHRGVSLLLDMKLVCWRHSR